MSLFPEASLTDLDDYLDSMIENLDSELYLKSIRWGFDFKECKEFLDYSPCKEEETDIYSPSKNAEFSEICNIKNENEE